MRLNEHAVHTWDIAVTFDDTATIPPDEAELIVDTLAMMAGFAGKPTGTERTLTVRTVAPERSSRSRCVRTALPFSPQPPVAVPDLELSGDALVRLVYGRLDPAHTPVVDAGASRARRATKGVPGLLILVRGGESTPPPDGGRPFPSGPGARRRPYRRSNLAGR